MSWARQIRCPATVDRATAASFCHSPGRACWHQVSLRAVSWWFDSSRRARLDPLHFL